MIIKNLNIIERKFFKLAPKNFSAYEHCLLLCLFFGNSHHKILLRLPAYSLLLLVPGYSFDFRSTTTISIAGRQKRKYVMLFCCPAATEINEDFVMLLLLWSGSGSSTKVVISHLSFMSWGVNPALSFSKSEALMLRSQGAVPGLVILWSSIIPCGKHVLARKRCTEVQLNKALARLNLTFTGHSGFVGFFSPYT